MEEGDAVRASAGKRTSESVVAAIGWSACVIGVRRMGRAANATCSCVRLCNCLFPPSVCLCCRVVAVAGGMSGRIDQPGGGSSSRPVPHSPIDAHTAHQSPTSECSSRERVQPRGGRRNPMQHFSAVHCSGCLSASAAVADPLLRACRPWCSAVHWRQRTRIAHSLQTMTQLTCSSLVAGALDQILLHHCTTAAAHPPIPSAPTAAHCRLTPLQSAFQWLTDESEPL